jgi:hypothetical protein
MNRNDIVMGAIILAVMAGGFLLLRNNQTPTIEVEPTPSTLETLEDQIENNFKVDVPDNAEKAELKDLNGGDGSGLATRLFENNRFSATLLVDLPEPAVGGFYQGWLSDGETFKSLGRLRVAKGGYMVDFSGAQNLDEFSEVIVSEEKASVSTPTNIVLEGSF